MKKDDVYLKVQGLGFMHNIENFGPMMDGYTLFGYQFNPQLGLAFSENLRIQGGVFIGKDFGTHNFKELAPTFTIRYHKNDFKMNFGTLDGSLNHNLVEPLYGFERVMTNRLENGMQFLLNKKRFDFDIWVDWQNMLYRLVNDYERFWLGVSSNMLKVKGEKLELKTPVAWTARHHGGQIARGGLVNGPDSAGVYTNINGSAGITLTYNTDKKSVQQLYVDVRYVYDKINTKDSTTYKRFSDGVSANIGGKFWGIDAMLSYWYGNNFKSEYGGEIYMSESSSITYANTYVSYRNMFILRLTKVFKLADKVLLTVRVQPQYDMDFGEFYYSYGVYINFDKNIFLKRK